MDAKEYLSRAFYLHKQIKAKEKRLEWLRDIAPGPSMRFSEEAKVPGQSEVFRRRECCHQGGGSRGGDRERHHQFR